MPAKPEFPVDAATFVARRAEREEICHQIEALARRAEAAGMAITAFMLDMAVIDERSHLFPGGLDPQ